MESGSETNASPNVFSFTPEDINRIMGGGLGDVAYLSVPSKVDIKRIFEFESRRNISLNLHLSLLGEYYKNHIIPRGLRSHLRPNLFPNNKDFCQRLEGLSNRYALEVILLNIEFLQQEIIQVGKKMIETEIKLKAVMEPGEFTTYTEKTANFLSKFRREQEDTKRHKWHRDKEDYSRGQVYSWQRENNKDNPRMDRRFKSQRKEYGKTTTRNPQTAADFLVHTPTTPGDGGTTPDVGEGDIAAPPKTRSGRNPRAQTTAQTAPQMHKTK